MFATVVYRQAAAAFVEDRPGGGAPDNAGAIWPRTPARYAGAARTTPTPPVRARSRVEGLDGLRGLAIAGVLAYHVAPSLARGGYLGVEVFFVLSGYLLTSRLFDQHRRHGQIDWSRYLRQRVRRLGPALAVFLMALVVLGAVVVRSDAYRLRSDVLWSALGLTNWHLISDGSSYFRQLGRPPLVRHLWSLAVEIQFYAVIPLVVAALLRWNRKCSVAALCAGIALSTLVMAVLYRSQDPSRAYYGTDARLGALLAGVLLALVLLPGEARREPPRWLGGIGAFGVVALVWLFSVAGGGSRPVFLGGFLLCRLATALVIAGALQRGPCAALLSRSLLSWLGRRSYSIYLWHWPLLVLLRPGVDVAWPPLVAVGVALTGALALGHLSYELVERPFLRRDRRPAPSPGRGRRAVAAAGWANAAVAAVATVVVLFSLPTVDPIADSLKAGQQVLASQPSAPVPPPPEATTTAPPEPAPATTSLAPPAGSPVTAVESEPVPVVPAGPEPGTVRVTAIGDSVMLSAAGPLQERLGATSYIDAKLSRQFAQGVVLARQLRQEGRLGEVVIVHLGTNGPPKASEVDALMRELEGVAHVRLVTVRMPQRWEAAANQTLREAAGRHPSMQIVDWYAHSEGRREWFESDGTHVKRSGAKAYAELLAASAVVSATSTTTSTSQPLPAEPAEPTTSTTSPGPPLVEPPTSQPPP